jgi:hypothetical protein
VRAKGKSVNENKQRHKGLDAKFSEPVNSVINAGYAPWGDPHGSIYREG